MEYRVKSNQNTYCSFQLLLLFDWLNYVHFDAWDAVGAVPNWEIGNVSAGASTVFDSGVALDTSYHVFRILCHTHGSNHVHYFIDDLENEVPNSPITSNVPTEYLQPYLFIATRQDEVSSIDADYCYLRQGR